MRKYCPKCRKPIHADWDRCVNCNAFLIPEKNLIEKILEEGGTRGRFWFLHLIGAILVVLVLVLPYQVSEEISFGPPIIVSYGYLWLVGVAYKFDVYYDVLYYAALYIVIFIILVKNLKRIKPIQDFKTVNKKRNVRILLLGIGLILVTAFILFYSALLQILYGPSTIYQIGPIVAFTAGSVLLFSGVLGLIKE